MSELAAKLGVVLPVSFFERDGNAHFNSLAMIDADGRNLGIYRKAHIPDGPGYQEKFYFLPRRHAVSRLADALRRRRRGDLLGPGGFRKPPAPSRSKAPISSSIRPRSAPSRRRRRRSTAATIGAG